MIAVGVILNKPGVLRAQFGLAPVCSGLLAQGECLFIDEWFLPDRQARPLTPVECTSIQLAREGLRICRIGHRPRQELNRPNANPPLLVSAIIPPPTPPHPHNHTL